MKLYYTYIKYCVREGACRTSEDICKPLQGLDREGRARLPVVQLRHLPPRWATDIHINNLICHYRFNMSTSTSDACEQVSH